ncbi:MAG: VacB/RNase II family 3'-5' exoribonuclease [Clostridia bacterium]|nr:VacB/RNase II family 3'-5' exoribonuclease [Clostridia bacterium]
MGERRKERAIGFVVSDGKYCYFKGRKGDLHSIPQTKEIKEIANSGNICVFEKCATQKTSDDFWQLLEVYGPCGDPIPEGNAIARAHGLFEVVPNKVKYEISALPKTVRPKDTIGYTDLRDVSFITIDPDSAKDFDDAVFAEKNEDGTITLRVAIANVGHYVRPDSAMFENAMKLGISSYLGNMVDPMFMEELSNGICSLNEGVDRLVMCTTANINPDGSLNNYTIEPAVIRSRHRLTYKEADYLYFGENVEGDDIDHSAKVDECKDVMDSLETLYEVASNLYESRMKRGAFDISTPELDFKLDESGKKIIKYTKSHNEMFTSVIEETAVLANEIWGEVTERLKIPAVYRNHDTIQFENYPTIKGKLAQFGIQLPKNPNSNDLQKIINSVKGKRIEEYIVSTILKEMKQAYYGVTNLGHTGLAVLPHRFNIFSQKFLKDIKFQESIDNSRMNYFKKSGSSNGLSFDGDITHSAYCHTTSPIRRGSDLINQSQMLNLIMNGNLMFNKNKIESYCDNLNFRERNSQRAEQEYNSMLSALWAKDNIGYEFEGGYIVGIGENNASLRTKDGLLLSVPYNYLGIKKKYLKIGQVIDKCYIADVSLYPSRILATRHPEFIRHSRIEKDNDEMSKEEE